MATEQFGDIVIAPRVLEKIIAIATAKVEGVYSLENKSVSDSLSKRSLGRGVSSYRRRRSGLSGYLSLP